MWRYKRLGQLLLNSIGLRGRGRLVHISLHDTDGLGWRCFEGINRGVGEGCVRENEQNESI